MVAQSPTPPLRAGTGTGRAPGAPEVRIPVPMVVGLVEGRLTDPPEVVVDRGPFRVVKGKR